MHRTFHICKGQISQQRVSYVPARQLWHRSSMARTPSIVKRPVVSRDAVAIPPTEATMQLTALVEHILVRKDGHLSEHIAEELDISQVCPANVLECRTLRLPRLQRTHLLITCTDSSSVCITQFPDSMQLTGMLRLQAHAKELIRFGSVHWCPVLPHVSESREAAMSEADRERYREARAAGIAQHGNNVNARHA